MKTLLTLTLMSLTATAHALPQKIQCESVQSPNHRLSVRFLKELNGGEILSRTYLASVHTLHGPRLKGEQFRAEVVATPISTRVEVGVSYGADLPDGSALRIEDLNYSAHDPHPGISGVFQTASGSLHSLTCR